MKKVKSWAVDQDGSSYYSLYLALALALGSIFGVSHFSMKNPFDDETARFDCDDDVPPRACCADPKKR